MKNNKPFRKGKAILAVTLSAAILTGLIGPATQAEAASKTAYISEVQMAYGSSAEDAKNKLTAQGFEVYDEDVNAGTGEDFVYLGYKTTTDPTKAITDIKAVEQDVGYQIYNSEDILAGMEGKAITDADALMAVISAFRDSYNSGAKRALEAYETLQCYRYAEADEETGKSEQLLGDFILNDATDTSLTDMVLYADPATFSGLVEMLAIGIYSDATDIWLTRVGEEIPEYKTDSVLKANARKLLKSIKSFQDLLQKDVELKEQIEQAGSEEEKTELEQESGGIELQFALTTLNKYTYQDTSLLEYFFQEDLTAAKLYDIVSVMTKADMTILTQLGLSGLCMVSDNVEVDSASASDQAEISTEDMDLSSPEYDFWSGSVKTDYKTIALTNETIRDITTGDEGTVIEGVSNAMFASTAAATGLAALGTASTAYLWSRYISTANMSKAFTEVEAFLKSADAYYDVGLVVESRVQNTLTMLEEDSFWVKAGAKPVNFQNVTRYFSKSTNKLLQNGKFMKAYRSSSNFAAAKAAAASRVSSKIAAVTSTIMMVAMIVLVGALIANSIREYFNPSYSVRPNTILSLEKMEDGDDGYVIYNAVLDGKGELSVGDTNAYQGLKWLALYTSADDLKGTPIKAGTLSTATDGTPITFFGQINAADLNKNARNHDETINLYFGKADENTLASVFSDSSMILWLGLIAAAFGIGVGVYYKKKQKREGTI